MFNSSTIPKRIPRVVRAGTPAGFLAGHHGERLLFPDRPFPIAASRTNGVLVARLRNAAGEQEDINCLFAYDRQGARTSTRTDSQRIAYGEKMPSGPFARALAILRKERANIIRSSAESRRATRPSPFL